MCLYPTFIINRKYIPNKKNGGVVPPIIDERTLYVPIGCQNCMECLKQKQREWSVRLYEEIKENKNGKFVTLTFSDESMRDLGKDVERYATGYIRDNLIATLGVRRYLERWRKKYGKSVKHWFITEWGQTNTERMHIHGIMWTNEVKDITDIWKYGTVFIGNFVNEQSVNYIVKYLGKYDEKHPNYMPKILASPGIGKGYLKSISAKKNKYKSDGTTKDEYRTKTGHKLSLPIYYRNNIYTEEEKEALWLDRLDKEEIWVMGEKIDVSDEKGNEIYEKTLKYYQNRNKRLGYGDNSVNWEKKRYLHMKRKIKAKTDEMKRRGKASCLHADSDAQI